jgi:hypothetical protein
MFLKEKRDGKVKGRTVTGGNKQRNYISKEDASSTTVATESVLLLCIIDAEKEQDVAVVDIPNAFIQTRVEHEKDRVFIKIRGVLVDILVEIAPPVYKPFFSRNKKGGTVAGTMPERPLQYNGCKHVVLSQVREDFDGY